MIIALGIAFCGYFGKQWYEMPPLSETDIEASTELNMAIEMAQGQHHKTLSEGKIERLREQIRQEVVGDYEAERKKLNLRFTIGLFCLIMGIGQCVFVFLAERSK